MDHWNDHDGSEAAPRRAMGKTIVVEFHNGMVTQPINLPPNSRWNDVKRWKLSETGSWI